MIKAMFVMEQHLGHLSFYQNMRRFVDQSRDVEATWVKVTYEHPGSWIKKLPLLPEYVKGSLAGRWQVQNALSNSTYDIALFNTQVPAVLGGTIVNRRPYVICTDVTPIQYDRMGFNYGHQPDKSGLIRHFKHQANKTLFQHAARLLPWSTWTGSSLIEDYGVSANRVEAIAPGVDIDVWKPNERPPCKPLRILFVGGDFYRKGGMLLIDACRQLPLGDIELILVTKSEVPQEPWIKVYKNMVPNSEELIRLYQSCDIFVLPTNGEAFGIAAVEATAVGLPVVATRIGGLTDIVTENETGFLIPPGSKQELVNRLQCLLEDCNLRHQMGQAARAKAEKRFNARKNVDRVIQILRENAGR